MNLGREIFISDGFYRFFSLSFEEPQSDRFRTVNGREYDFLHHWHSIADDSNLWSIRKT